MQAAIRIRPDYGAAYFMLGTVLKQKGDLTGAESALREAIRLNSSDPGPYNTLGQVLRQKGDITGSRAAFADGAAAKKKLDDSQAEMLNGKK
jgi:predicted Zn-dependent protease